MAVDQVVLARMIAGAASDLAAATASLDSINNTIVLVTEDDTLYKAMMDEAKAELETRLGVKVVGFDTNFPADAPHAVVYGSHYNVDGISDWEIQKADTTVVYRYSNEIVDAYTHTLAGSEETQQTVRNILTGFSQDCAWIRLALQAHPSGLTILNNVSIGERDGLTQNIVDGTHQFFTFSGDSRISINPGLVGYSDWLQYAIDMTKEYFVTFFVEGTNVSRDNTLSGTHSYTRDGDYATEEDWGVLGSASSRIRAVSALQGWASGSGPGWDADALITQWITDWDKTYPLVYNNPYGTYYFLRALNQGQPLIAAKKTLITNRNPILSHYVV